MKDDFQGVDPFDVLEEVLAQNSLSEDERKVVEEARAHFIRILEHFDDDDVIDALHAVCRYGMIVGHYLKVRDPATLQDIERLRAQVGGFASGKARKARPWHARAKELANEFLSNVEKRVSYAEIARSITDNWNDAKNPLPTTLRTLEGYVSGLDEEGDLPWPDGV